MRILWISCLLIGSITCSPVWKAQEQGAPEQAGTSHMAPSYPASWGSGGVESSGLGSSSSLSSPSYAVAGGPAMAGGYTGGFAGASSGAGVYAGSGFGGYGAASAPAGAYDGSGGSYGAGYEAGSHGSAMAPAGGADWSSGSTSYQGAGDQSSGPFFSDVSDLDPVYGFSYRSRYQKGRAVFAQSRYTPGEPLVQPMPIYRPVIKNPVMLNIPVQEPVKQYTPVKAPQQQAVPVKFQTKGGY